MNKKRMSRGITLAIAILMVLQLVIVFPAVVQAAPDLGVANLECEYTKNPLGIDNTTPAFSWQLQSTLRGVTQNTYRVMVSSSSDNLAANNYDVWDSGVVSTEKSVDVKYAGAPLTSGSRYFWKVSVTDNKGNSATSSEQAFFQMGMLQSSDWQARWIELDTAAKPTPSKYTIDFDFKIIKDNAGFIFAGKDSGSFLMWQINTQETKFGGETSFRPHRWKNNGASVYSGHEFLINSAIPKATQFNEHHMTIKVDGNLVTTYIDSTQIDQMTVEAGDAAFGKIGFRQNFYSGVNDEQAEYDNIIIKDDTTGQTLFSDDFSTPVNRNFAFGTIRDGKLFVERIQDFQRDATSAPMYRKTFNLSGTVKSASLYASALGLYEMYINGQRVGDDFFNPGWTNYEKNVDNNNYVMYQTFDVTDLVRSGNNAIGAITGHGWYSGKLFIGGNNRYGTGSKLLGQLVVTYTNGDKEIIKTDSSWQTSTEGPILTDDFQQGETYDANREMPGWSEATFTPQSTWQPARESSYAGGLVAQMGPTVKKIKEFKPVSVNKLDSNTYIVNLGQNISGFARISVNGPKNTLVKMRFGEMLNADGSLYTANLRSAQATDYYLLKGDAQGEVWQPRFTFHGFQYIEVTNYPGTLTANDITGVALSSLQEQTGNFETSNALVNKLQSNITWGQRDNFISVPTDCPQRDERLGYTGDGQVFIRTAAMNMDVNQFFRKFMLDVTSNQRTDGAIADWTPNYVTSGDGASGSFGNSGWGDAVVVMPWTIYSTYGDSTVITRNYNSMKKWIARYQNLGGSGYIVETSAYGDWLSINAETPKDVISTAYFAYCSDLMSRMAGIVGNTTDQQYYSTLFNNIKAAFNSSFVDAEGHVKGRTQTSYLLALKFNLLPTQALREKAAEYLVADIKAKNWHLSTGFIGVAYLNPVLTEMGYEDVAYRLMLQESYPSWLYSVTSGATTIWERWNSYSKETGAFGDVGMNSFNHYSLGSIGEWFYNYAAGIKPDDAHPGFKQFIINPHAGAGLDYINCSYESVYGKIVSNWKYVDGKFTLEATVPANSTAKIYVPATSENDVFEGGVKASTAQGLTFLGIENGKAVYQAGSGSYVFTSQQSQRVMLTIANENNVQGSMVEIEGTQYELPTSQVVGIGDQITIKARPTNDIDYLFDSWSGDMQSTDSQISVNISGNTSLVVKNKPAPQTAINLALSKTVNASTSINSGDWNANNLVDGRYTSVSGHLGFTSNSSSTETVNHYVEVDLGKNEFIDFIKIYPRTDVLTADGKTASFPKDFKIQVRKNGESTYTDVKTFTDYTAPYKKPALIAFDGQIEARYVRIAVSKLGAPPSGEPYYFQLSELGIYAAIDKAPLETALAAAKVYVDQAGDFGTLLSGIVSAYNAGKTEYDSTSSTPASIATAVTNINNALNALTAQKVADMLAASSYAPSIVSGKVKLPSVPTGFTVQIANSTPLGLIAADGTITPPAQDTTVNFSLKVLKTGTSDTALASTPYSIPLSGQTYEAVAGIAPGLVQYVVADGKDITCKLSAGGYYSATLFTIQLNYDPSKLTLKSPALTMCSELVAKNAFAFNESNSGGVYKVYIGVPGGMTSAELSELVSVNFTRVSDTIFTSDVTLSKFGAVRVDQDDNSTILNVTISNPTATVKVVNIKTLCDISGNGVVDLADLSVAIKYYTVDSTSPLWPKAKVADINGDGVVDMSDLIIITANMDE